MGEVGNQKSIAAGDVRMIRISPPDWWRQHSRRTLEEKYQWLQKETLSDFGLPRPVAVEEQEELIDCCDRGQRREGAARLLEYDRAVTQPGRVRRQQANVVVFSGIPDVDTLSKTEPLPPANASLYNLSTRSERVQYETGCTPGEAVDFLLSAVPFVFPWVVACARLASGVIDLRVGSPIVPRDHVRRAYSEAVAFLEEKRPETVESAPTHRRNRPSRTPGLVSFVEERRRSENKKPKDWDSLRAEWEKEHPELRPFPSTAAMREAYRRAKKRV